MKVHEATTRGSDPETAIAITKHSPHMKLPRGCGKAVAHFHTTVHEPPDCATLREQQRAIAVLGQSVETTFARQRIKLLLPRSPSPHAATDSTPQVFLAIRIYASD